jgi:hypothetical protein
MNAAWLALFPLGGILVEIAMEMISFTIHKSSKFLLHPTMSANSRKQYRNSLVPKLSPWRFLSSPMLLAVLCSGFSSTLAFAPQSTSPVRTSPTGFYADWENTICKRGRTFRLQYRDGDTGGVGSTQQLKNSKTDVAFQQHTSRWWKAFLPSSPPTVDQTSEKVDEYLEFLDRRYHQIHDEEITPTPAPKFSALKWLQGGQEDIGNISDQQHDNALYVLGVAGLASQRLLQKHAAGYEAERQEVPTTSAVCTERAIDAVLESRLALNWELSALFAPLTAVLRLVSIQRNVLARQQTLRIRTVTAFLTKNVTAGATKVARAAWSLGGGKKNVAWTMAVMAAFILLLLRPIVESAIGASAA